MDQQPDKESENPKNINEVAPPPVTESENTQLINDNIENSSNIAVESINSEITNKSDEPKFDSSLNLDTNQQSEVINLDNSIKENKEKRKNLIKNIVLGILVVVVIILVWQFAENDKTAKTNSDFKDNVNIKVSEIKENGTVNIVNSTGTAVSGKNLVNNEVFGDKVKILVFFGNSGYNKDSKDCSLVYSLERFVDRKYDSLEINTIRGLLEPISTEERAQGYYSSIPDGTILKQLKISGDTAEVNLSGKIATMGGSCAVSAVRSQITMTLMQFPDIKNVNICIDGNCNQDEILQP